jgi:hypothetical protein
MNRLLSCFFVACCATVLFSCQKELSEEVNSALTAAGSLWDSTSTCLPDSVHGTFYGGITPGSDTAYVEVQVNVTQTGSYSITSDLQDGFEFADSGFFSSTGLNTIHLKPLGTPIIPTTSTFSISFDSSFCSFTVVIQDSTGTGLGGQHLDAQGSLWDSTGACLPNTVFGTFYNGIKPGNDTAYVEVQVNVTQTGSYSIVSDLQNGFEFSDSGFFNTTGLNTIRLKPIGVPIIPIATTFSINFGSSLCAFTVNVKDSTGSGVVVGTTAGTWQFTQGTSNYAGIITDASKDNSTGVVTFVNLSGNGSTGDTSMTLNFSILGSDIQPGTYTTIPNTIQFSSGDFLNDFSYAANAFVTGSDMTIIVSSYDTATKEMKGTFSGNAQSGLAGPIVPITNGSFDVMVP